MGRKRRAARRAAPAAHGAARGLRGGAERSGDCTRAGSARGRPLRPAGTAPPRTAPWGHPARPQGGARRGGTPRDRVLGAPCAPSSLCAPRGTRTPGADRDAERLAATSRVPLVASPALLALIQRLTGSPLLSVGRLVPC